MLRKLLPVLLACVGLGGGIAVGKLLQAPPAAAEHGDGADAGDHAADDHAEDGEGHEVEAEADDHGSGDDSHAAEGEHGEGGPEYVKMNNQFVVPVVKDGRVDAMVVLAISLEVEAGNTDQVYQREPKLRDVFLQVMFDHANVGGFGGTFTDGSNLVVLRTNLKEAAAMILGTTVRDVLITDIARQDS